MTRPSPAGLGDAALAAATVGVAAASLIGFAGGLGWWADLASHFRVQYLAGSLLLSALAALARRPRTAAALGACAVLNGGVIAPMLLRAGPPATAGTALRVVSVNVHTEGRAYERVAAFLRDSDPDVALLMEVDQAWLAALAPTLRGYPWRVEAPRPDNFGIALYSRHPCAACRVVDLGAGVPSVTGEIEVGGRALRVVGTHPLPPVTAGNAADHAAQLRALAERIRRDTLPVVLVGDLNTTPWSARYRALLRASGLRRDGDGPRWTWPTGAWPLAIEIDHVLVTAGITARASRGPDVGSDHFPLIAELHPDR